jgi:hypothetical protein
VETKESVDTIGGGVRDRADGQTVAKRSRRAALNVAVSARSDINASSTARRGTSGSLNTIHVPS